MQGCPATHDGRDAFRDACSGCVDVVPRAAYHLWQSVIVGHKAAPHDCGPCASVLPAASYGTIWISRRAIKRRRIATTSGSHHRNKFLRIHRTRPLQRYSSPCAPQLKPSSNRFEPTAQKPPKEYTADHHDDHARRTTGGRARPRQRHVQPGRRRRAARRRLRAAVPREAGHAARRRRAAAAVGNS